MNGKANAIAVIGVFLIKNTAPCMSYIVNKYAHHTYGYITAFLGFI